MSRNWCLNCWRSLPQANPQIHLQYLTFFAPSLKDQTKTLPLKRDRLDLPNLIYHKSKSGSLNPVYSPDVDWNVLLIFVTAQEGMTIRMSLPSHCQHHRVSCRYATCLYFLNDNIIVNLWYDIARPYKNLLIDGTFNCVCAVVLPVAIICSFQNPWIQADIWKSWMEGNTLYSFRRCFAQHLRKFSTADTFRSSWHDDTVAAGTPK